MVGAFSPGGIFALFCSDFDKLSVALRRPQAFALAIYRTHHLFPGMPCAWV